MNKKQKNSYFSYDKRYSYVVIMVAALLFLFIGYLLGMAFYESKSQAQESKLKNIVAVLGSDVVPSIMSYGKVVSINNREIVMAFNEDEIKIKIKNDAKVHSLTGKLSGEQTPFDFNRIKVGDMLSVNIGLDQEGNFIGDSVIDFTQD